MRKNLKKLRTIDNTLTQGEMAERIGVSRNYYCFVESGRTNGSLKFWSDVQKAFNVPDSEMYPLMRNEGVE